MQILKVVKMIMFTAIAFFWSFMRNPARTAPNFRNKARGFSLAEKDFK
jgi:hypothetical protein